MGCSTGAKKGHLHAGEVKLLHLFVRIATGKARQDGSWQQSSGPWLVHREGWAQDCLVSLKLHVGHSPSSLEPNQNFRSLAVKCVLHALLPQT